MEEQLKESITLDELHALFLTLDAIEAELSSCFHNRFFKIDLPKEIESSPYSPIRFITGALGKNFEECEYMSRGTTTIINNQMVLNNRITLNYDVVKFGIKFQVEIPLDIARVTIPQGTDEKQLCELYVINPPKPRLSYIVLD